MFIVVVYLQSDVNHVEEDKDEEEDFEGQTIDDPAETTQFLFCQLAPSADRPAISSRPRIVASG